MTHEERMAADQQMVELWLADYADGLWPYGKLAEAMSYSLLSGGKRIRPVLTLAACRFCGGAAEDAIAFACGLEMVHTYSLIHDDLPCMDNDDFRRGKPTNHRVYGQTNAILAGDALLTASFEVLSKAENMPAQQLVKAISCLAEAAGAAGMVAGQVLDMDGNGQERSVSQIQTIESLKTGQLIVAAVKLGCIASGQEEKMDALCNYAAKLGLAFQVQDDVLDYDGNEQELGKPIGSDKANGKTTFVSLLGVDACRQMVRDLSAEAIASVSPYEGNEFLCWLAQRLASRRK